MNWTWVVESRSVVKGSKYSSTTACFPTRKAGRRFAKSLKKKHPDFLFHVKKYFKKTKGHQHWAIGVTFKGEYQSNLRLAYTKPEAWTVAIHKSNSRSRQQAVARGWGVCDVRVTMRQMKRK